MADNELILRKLLDKIAKEQTFADYHIEIKELSSSGANYTSALLLAKITGSNNDDLNLFAKVATLGENIREQMPTKMYETEHYVYTKLADVYEKLQNKHGIPNDNRLILSKFYGANTTLYEETIVLENLETRGFTTYNRFKSIDWAYASKAVETMAKLHALSIAYSVENPEEFNQVVEKFKPELDETKNMDWLNTLIDQALKVTKDEYRDRLKKYLDKKTEPDNFSKYFTPIRRAVLIHGDYRMSNLMHRVNEDNKMEVIPVDLQTIRVGPPIIDLMYFIFTGSDEEFRAKYFDRLLDWYYQELHRFLRALHVDPDHVYSREDFEYELEECRSFGMLSSVFGLPITTVEVDNAPLIDKDADISAFAITKTSDLYARRMNGVIDDYIRWGWL